MAVAGPERTLAASGPLPRPLVDHHGHRCCLDRRNARSLVGWDEQGYRVAVLPLKCRSWRCVCCAPQLLRRNRARAFRGATGRVAMVTLTIPAGAYAGKPNGARLSIRRCGQSWNRLRTILGREWGGVAYFKGLELTKAGVAHVHVLVRVSSLADYWRLRTIVQRSAVRAGFGKVSQVDIARRPGDVARYVSKGTAGSGRAAAYATKGIDGRVPKWTRRASWSKDWSDWIKPTPIAGFTWSVQPLHAAGLVGLYSGSDFTVVDPERLRVHVSPAGPAERAG